MPRLSGLFYGRGKANIAPPVARTFREKMETGATPVLRVNVSLTPKACGVIVGAFSMNAALTIQILTRALAMRAVVSRDSRGSWLVIPDYLVPGGQE